MSNLGGYDRSIVLHLKFGEEVKIPEGEEWLVITKNIQEYGSKKPVFGANKTGIDLFLLGSNTILSNKVHQNYDSEIIGIAFSSKSNKKLKYSHSSTIYLDVGERLEIKNQIVRISTINSVSINGKACNFSTPSVVLGEGISLGKLPRGTINLQFFDVVE